MIHDQNPDCDEPEAAIDTFDFDLKEFDLGNDPSDDDITFFHEDLEKEAGQMTYDDGEDIAADRPPVAIPKDYGHASTALCAHDSQDGCFEFKDGLNAVGPVIEAVKSPDNIDSGSGNYNDLSITDLVQRVIGQDSRGTINRETNALCAQILNHPEVTMHPEVLPIFACYNDGMRAHGDDPIKAGLWLYRPEKQGERKSCDKWDPEAPFALAFVAPSKQGGDPGKNRLNLHFGGRESFLGNVVFKYHAGGADSRMDCRFVARRYQRVRLVGSGIPEDTFAVDAAESVVSDPQMSDTRLAATGPGGNNLPCDFSGGLAADGGESSVSEMLNELLCARRRKNIASKCELLHKFSSRPDMKDLFSDKKSKSQLRQACVVGGDDVHNEHAKRGRFKGKAKENEKCTDEELAEFFSEMSMESSRDGTVAVPPEKFLDKCISMVIRHLSAHLDEDASRQVKKSLDEIHLTQVDNTSRPFNNEDDDVLTVEVAAGVGVFMKLGAALMDRSCGIDKVKVSSYKQAQENFTLPNSPSGEYCEPFQPFMTKVQEERARMVALFEAVSPGKLVILDELVEKHARENGFDQMWVSYQQKWGAAAVENARAKVRKRSEVFYRAKMVALFAVNQPDDLQEIDELIAKHAGNYDQMFKQWVEFKKFDICAVAAAHSKALEEVEVFDE